MPDPPTLDSDSRVGDFERSFQDADERDPRVAGSPSAVADAEFALLLTHDVDRPYKTVQSVYYAFERRDPRQLKALLPGVNPWWQYENIADLEDSLGVRSAFYFLRERHLLERAPTDWLDPFYWVEHLGRYDVEAPEMRDLLDELQSGGWEVGLHGSYDAYDDRDRLRTEKTTLEAALGERVVGGRQHHLNRGARTWEYHRDVGLRYDASLGSSETFGFDHGYLPLRPFADEFVVFPLTVMECALTDPGEDFGAAWSECERLLNEAADNGAVMSALWHPRVFNGTDFPGYRRLYRRLVERALEMGAWVGPPADYYDLMAHPGENDGEERSGTEATEAERNETERTESEVTETGRTESENPGVPTTGAVPDGFHRSHLRAPQAEDNKVERDANTESTG